MISFFFLSILAEIKINSDIRNIFIIRYDTNVFFNLWEYVSQNFQRSLDIQNFF